MKQLNKLLTVSLLLLIISAVQSKSAVLENDTIKKIDAYLEQLQKEKGFSGGVLIIQNGKKLLSKGYGWANKEKQIPFEENTLACMGSITKAFTATAILKLAEQGKLKLEDPISKYFENVPKDKAGITIHQLLTHSSGFHEFLKNDGGDYEKLERDEFIKRAFSEPLSFIPGSKAVYTNVGMSLLAAIIEKISGITYEAFLKKELLDPAGAATIAYNYKEIDEKLIALGYNQGKTWGTLQQRYKENGGGPYWNLLGNGGLYASLSDMYNWMMAIENKKILNEASIKKMFTPHIAEEGYNGTSFFGYGCNISKSRRGTNLIDNGGSNGIYFARMVRLTDDGIMIYVVTNDNTLNANDIVPNISQLYFNGEIDTDFTEKQPGFETPKGEAVYNLILNKGADYFIKNYKEEFKQLAVPPDDDMILLDAGQHLLNAKKADEALALYTVYTKEFPNIVIAWNDMGDAYLLKEDKVNAKKCFEKALQLRPNNQRAKEALENLK